MGGPGILYLKFRELRLGPINLWNSTDYVLNSNEVEEQGFGKGEPGQGQ